MFSSPSKKRYSAEEKEQLLANLDLEVEHRTNQIKAWLADALQNLRLHGESQISRIPRVVRDISLADFAKYNGNVQDCVKAMARDALGTEQNRIDRTTLKRKWVASQEEMNAAAGPSSGTGSTEAESSRGLKSARTAFSTPKKKPSSIISSAAQKPRFAMPRTPGTARQMQRIPPSVAVTPSPHKMATGKPSLYSRQPSRPASPSKLPSPSKAPQVNANLRTARPPSSSTFNPTLPPQPRWPRRDESMMSVNGSPLANPYQLGLNGYLKTVTRGDADALGDTDGSDAELPRYPKGPQTLKKKSSIIIRSSSSSHGHSRTNSQSSLAQSHASRPAHSRNASRTEMNGVLPSRTDYALNAEDACESGPMLSLSAFVSVPTKDGHVLEFDPLRTSPGEIDALEGITESAKKQAKEDMARSIQAAMDRWKIS